MSFPWLDPEEKTEIVKAKPEAIEQTENSKWLRKAQKKLLDKSTRVIEDALLFRDIDPSQPSPPDEWVSKLGQVEAERRFRVAKAAWMSAKEAPVAFKIAKDVFVGISKALSADAGAPKVLNMQAVQINLGPPQELPRVRIERKE